MKHYQPQCRQPRSWQPIWPRNYVSMDTQCYYRAKFTYFTFHLGVSILTLSCSSKCHLNFHWSSLPLRTEWQPHHFVFSGLENVKNVTVLAQTDVSITLKWEKVQNISTYILRYGHNSSMEVNRTEAESITQEIPGLTPSTKYNFTIITVRDESVSTGHTIEAVTSKQD